MFVGTVKHDTFDVETDANARPFSTRQLGITEGVTLTARGGPVVSGDEWSIGFGYEWPRDNLSAPSPRQAWRSCDTDDQPDPIVIEWTLSNYADESLFPGTAWALPIIGHNIPAVTLGVKVGGSFVDIPVDLGITAVGFDRTGVIVSAPTASGHDGSFAGVVRENEFAGGTWYAEPGGIGRRIVGNTAGTWSRTTTHQQARLILESVDDVGDPTSGATGIIVPPQAVIIGPSTQATTIDAVRIKIAKPDGSTDCEPPDRVWRIGYAAPMRVLPHADEYDWGRVIETRSPTDLTDMPGHVRRSRVTGPARRIVSVAWADGPVDTSLPDVTSFSTSGWSPAYTAGPLASTGNTPWQVESLVAALDGPDKPMLYLPRVAFTSTVNVLNRRHELVHMRLTTPVRLEVVQGTEGSDEVIRVATITGEEEV